MSGENYVTEQQRPDLGIEAVSPAAPVAVTDEQYPWLSEARIDVPTVEIRLANSGSTLRYGSAVGGNNALARIADDVPSQHSASAERSMFKGLSMLLQGQRTSTVEYVPYTGSVVPVYKTTNKGADAPRLFFSISTDDSGNPVVIKLGIATHKKQQQLLGVLKGDSGKRRKKDG